MSAIQPQHPNANVGTIGTRFAPADRWKTLRSRVQTAAVYRKKPSATGGRLTQTTQPSEAGGSFSSLNSSTHANFAKRSMLGEVGTPHPSSDRSLSEGGWDVRVRQQHDVPDLAVSSPPRRPHGLTTKSPEPSGLGRTGTSQRDIPTSPPASLFAPLRLRVEFLRHSYG